MTRLTQFFERLKADFIATSAAYLVLGLILVIFPAQVASVACYILGALLIAAGIVFIIKFFSCRGISSLFSLTLIGGIVLTAIGIFIITRSEIIIQIVPFIFGIIAIIDGIIALQRSLILAKVGFPFWWLSLVLSVITVALGIVVAINPFESGILAFRFIGVCLIFAGIADLWGITSLSKKIKMTKEADYVIENPDESQEK